MVGMPFHSFVTGFTNEYSNLKRQERAHNSAMSIRELELGAQADADKQKNQSEYGGFMVDHLPKDRFDTLTSDGKKASPLHDYATAISQATDAQIASMGSGPGSERERFVEEVMALAWNPFATLDQKGMGENSEMSYPVFENMDAFKRLPELYERMMKNNPSHDVSNTVFFDKNALNWHDMVKIKPDHLEELKKKIASGEAEPESLYHMPSEIFSGVTGDWAEIKDAEELQGFVEQITEILKSNQYGRMSTDKAVNNHLAQGNEWKAFTSYVAFAYDTQKINANEAGYELAQIAARFELSDDEVFNDAAHLGLRFYDVNRDGTTVKHVMRGDVPSQVDASNDNAMQRANELQLMLQQYRMLVEKGLKSGEILPAMAGDIDAFAKMVFEDKTSQLASIGDLRLILSDQKTTAMKNNAEDVLENDGLFMTYLQGVEDLVNYAYDPANKDATFIPKSHNTAILDSNYKIGKKAYSLAAGESLQSYAAKRVMEVSIAYRLAVIEQGSQGNTISDKDFKHALSRIRGRFYYSGDAVLDQVKQIQIQVNRTALMAKIRAHNPQKATIMNTLYNSYVRQKQKLWLDIESALTPTNENPALQFLAKRLVNQKKSIHEGGLGVVTWESGFARTGIFSDLRDDEWAYLMGKDTALATMYKNMGNDGASNAAAYKAIYGIDIPDEALEQIQKNIDSGNAQDNPSSTIKKNKKQNIYLKTKKNVNRLQNQSGLPVKVKSRPPDPGPDATVSERNSYNIQADWWDRKFGKHYNTNGDLLTQTVTAIPGDFAETLYEGLYK